MPVDTDHLRWIVQKITAEPVKRLAGIASIFGRRQVLLAVFLIPGFLMLAVMSGLVYAQGPAYDFTYQGRLKYGGQYLTGTCSITFKLFDASEGGNQLGPTLLRNNVPLTNGYFTVILNFGDVFTGTARYLEVSQVNCGQPGDPVALSGRIKIQGVPYAMTAVAVNQANQVSWNDILNIPAPFADNIDNGLISCQLNQTLLWSGGQWTCTSYLTDHSAFTGLNDDDHPQYVRVDGTRPMQGNLNMNSNPIINAQAAVTNTQAVVYEQAVKSGDPAGGDLSGTYPAPVVAQLQGQPVSTTLPALNQVLTWQSGQWAPADPRAGGPAGGDLAGMYPNPVVVGIQGKPVTATVPSSGQVLQWNNAAGYWEPGDVVVRYTPAGGSLAGVYPDPIVARLHSFPITSTAPSDQDVLMWNGKEWQASVPQIIGPAGGDLAGMHPNPTVVAVQGRPVASTAPGINQVLAWDGLSWIPSVVKTLQGRLVSPAAPAENQVLTWNAGSNQWEPGHISTLQGRPIQNLTPADGNALRWNGAAGRWEPGEVTHLSDTVGGHLTGTISSPQVRPDVVGMKQLNLPMGYGSGQTQMSNSQNVDLYIFPPSAQFTPPATGHCLVSADAFIKSTGTAYAQNGPWLKTAKKTPGGASGDTGLQMMFTPGRIDSHISSGAAASFVWEITPADVGQTVQFGCLVRDPSDVSGQPDYDYDETVYCRVMFICR